MDHLMPGMDGLEAARLIRTAVNTDYARTVPIIALTANALPGSEQYYLENGFQDYLTKPIDRARLAAIINKYFSTDAGPFAIAASVNTLFDDAAASTKAGTAGEGDA
jgi:CheY-like chemotaxis protein